MRASCSMLADSFLSVPASLPARASRGSVGSCGTHESVGRRARGAAKRHDKAAGARRARLVTPPWPHAGGARLRRAKCGPCARVPRASLHPGAEMPCSRRATLTHARRAIAKRLPGRVRGTHKTRPSACPSQRKRPSRVRARTALHSNWGQRRASGDARQAARHGSRTALCVRPLARARPRGIAKTALCAQAQRAMHGTATCCAAGACLASCSHSRNFIQASLLQNRPQHSPAGRRPYCCVILFTSTEQTYMTLYQGSAAGVRGKAQRMQFANSGGGRNQVKFWSSFVCFVSTEQRAAVVCACR